MTATRSITVSLLALFAVAGCASSGMPSQRQESTYIPGASGTFSVSPDNGALTAILPASLEQVWRSLPIAFDSAGVPLSIVDPKKHVIGNEGFKIRAKMGKTRLSTYFECGTTQVGPNADSYELYVTVMAQVEAVGTDKTRMTTTATASAKPLQFAQDYSRCTSKAELEKKIFDVVSGSLRK